MEEQEQKQEHSQANSNYTGLSLILNAAISRASIGKGKERHATGNPFEEQPICVVQRLLYNHPFGGLAFQVIKKTIESGRLYHRDRRREAKDEILDAINYLGAIGILIDETSSIEEGEAE